MSGGSWSHLNELEYNVRKQLHHQKVYLERKRAIEHFR